MNARSSIAFLIQAMLFLLPGRIRAADFEVHIPETISREVSIHVGTLQTPDIREVVSHEVSIYVETGKSGLMPEIVSREISLAISDSTPPPLVTFQVSNSPRGDRVTLDWSAYNAWRVRDISHFLVFVSDRPIVNVEGLQPAAVVGGESTGVVLENLPEFRDHSIAVVAVDALGNRDPKVISRGAYILTSEIFSREVSIFSGTEPVEVGREVISREMSVVMTTPEPPAVIQFVGREASGDGRSVTLDWSAYNQWLVGDVARYEIYLSPRVFSSVAGMTPFAIVPGEQQNVSFTGLPAFQDHFFAIVPVDALGNREVGVYPTGVYIISGEVFSREHSIFVGEDAQAREALSREFSVLRPTREVPAPVAAAGNSVFKVETSKTRSAIDMIWTDYNEWLQQDIVRYRIYASRTLFDDVTVLRPFAFVTDGRQEFTVRGLLGGHNYYLAAVAEDALGQYDTRVFSRSAQASQPPDLPVPPIVLQAPVGQSVVIGQPAHLSALAAGDAPIRYQWRLNGQPLRGETNPVLSIASMVRPRLGSYTLQIVNEYGNVLTEPAILKASGLPLLELSDDFSGRPLRSEESFVGTANNLTATFERGEPRHALKPGGHSVWMTWRAPADGVVTFSTRGSSFDTLLAIYVGKSLQELATGEVAHDEESGGFHTSIATFQAARGTEYEIAVDGFAGAAGEIVLGWELDTGASPVPRVTRHPESKLVGPGSPVSLSGAAAGTDLSYRWFKNGVAIPNANLPELTFSQTSVADLGSYRLAVRKEDGAEVFSDPATLGWTTVDSIRVGLTDKLRALIPDAEQGATPQAPGDPWGSLSLGLPGSVYANNSGASLDEQEAVCYPEEDGQSMWWRFRVTTNAQVVLDTRESQVDTVLSAYHGPPPLRRAGCNDNSNPPSDFTSRLMIDATAGRDYFVQIYSLNGGGVIRLNWTLRQGGVEVPREVSARLVDGQLELLLTTNPGLIQIESSSNLRDWTVIRSFESTGREIRHREPLMTGVRDRFFRIRK